MDQASLARSLAHIQANLDGDLSLNALSSIAGCSPPYFARCFANLLGETPKQYTLRLRLEKAALRLAMVDDSILDIALDCGFANHETFTRAFRHRFKKTPSAFRVGGRRSAAKFTAENDQIIPQRVVAAKGAPQSLSATVVRTLQPMSLAYIRHTGPYESVPITLWDALIDWARRNAIPGPFVLLGIAHDAPGITAPEKLRFDAAIRVPGEFRAGRRVGYQRFAGGLHALTTSVGPFTSLPFAYEMIFERLGRDRSFECLGVPCLEFYRVNRVAADVAIVHTEIAIPLRRRR